MLFSKKTVLNYWEFITLMNCDVLYSVRLWNLIIVGLYKRRH